MKYPTKIKSGFAFLDVLSGRHGLYKYFDSQKTPKPIKVKIEGYITGVHGNDDGVSREFTIEVNKVIVK